MAQDGSKGGQNVNGLNSELLEGRSRTGKVLEGFYGEYDREAIDSRQVNGEKDRNEALEQIQNETGDTRLFPESSEDIGGAYITGTMITDIDPFELADQKPEGNGA